MKRKGLLTNILYVIRLIRVIAQLILGGMMAISFDAIMLIWGIYFIYETFFNGKYAYTLVALILIPTIIYLIGLTILAFCCICCKVKKAKTIYKCAYSKLNDLTFSSMSSKFCRFVFILSIIQFWVGKATGSTFYDDNNPILVVSILLGLGSGIGWLVSSLTYYFDKKSMKLKGNIPTEKFEYSDNVLSIWWNCVKYPYTVLCNLLKENFKEHQKR